MWKDNHYCWVVLCKNHWFHARDNLFFVAIESSLPRQIPTCLFLFSRTASRSGAISAGRSIPINADKC